MSKISVVVTVLNEQKSIRELLKALLDQTKKAAEIIIIDAGSIDKTVKIIREFQRKYKKIRLIVYPGVNRSKGRNIGIKRAQSEIVAITDAGCIPKKDWLNNLTKPFKDKAIDVVGGYYEPVGDSILQKSLALFTSVLPNKFNPNTYLPASRSIAFRKKIWKKVGGYPEEYDTCEDLVFIQRLRDKEANIKIQKNAKVLWMQHNTWKKAFKQFFNYAEGDAQALYKPHLKKILLVYLRYLIGIYLFFSYPTILTILVPTYFLWAISKGLGFVKDIKAIVVLPFLQIMSDVAVMAGALSGLRIRLDKALQ